MRKVKTTNQQASNYVRKWEPFTNSNNQLYGEWVTRGCYAVFSYGAHWPLYIWRNGVWFENEDKYSVTTTRHSTYAHPRTETKKRTCLQMLNIIRGARMDCERAA